MKEIVYLVGKDLKNFITDARSLFLALLFPLILVFMVVYVYPSGGEEDRGKFTFGLVSQEDEEGVSREMITFLEKVKSIPLQSFNFEEAYQRLQEEKIEAFLFFPSDFTSRLYSGENTVIEVYTNPENVKGRLAALRLGQGLANQISYAQSSFELVKRQKGISIEELAERVRHGEDFQVIPSLVEPVSMNFHNIGPLVPLNRVNWALPAFFTMFVFLASSLGAVDLVKEKEHRILERLAVRGTTKGIILGAKFFSSFIKGMVQIIFLWSAGIFIFNLYPGSSLFALFFLSALFVAVASAFSLYIVSTASNSSFAFSLGVISSLIMAPLGGCWWPVYLMPPWMSLLGRLTPHYWANSAFSKLLISGGDLEAIAIELTTLLIFVIALYFYSVKKFDYV